MAKIGKMAKNWKNKAESPEKDAMQLPSRKDCRPRATPAARSANKGILERST